MAIVFLGAWTMLAACHCNGRLFFLSLTLLPGVSSSRKGSRCSFVFPCNSIPIAFVVTVERLPYKRLWIRFEIGEIAIDIVKTYNDRPYVDLLIVQYSTRR